MRQKQTEQSVLGAVEAFEADGMAAIDLSARTREEYSRDLRQLAAFLSKRGVNRIGAVHRGHLGQWLADQERRELKASTRRRKAYAAKTFFRHLAEHAVIEDDPAAGLRPPKQRPREPRYLSRDEYQRLLRACSHHPRDAAIIEVLLQTGMRLAELVGLHLGDVELPARATQDPENVGIARVTRKGGKRVTIPLNYKACRAVTAWLKVRPEVEEVALFLNKYRRPLSRRAVQRAVGKYLEEAGIEDASVHSLRHTMATHHVAAGTDLKTLQETLGHADLATTAMYVQLAKQAQRRALQEHAL